MLKVHREMKEMPVYALRIAKNGPKLSESSTDDEHVWRVGANGGIYRIIMQTVAVEDIATGIAGSFGLDLPIVDRTGLTGKYNGVLTYRPAWVLRDGGPDLPGISIFDALQQQLGLRLVREKAMLEMLVVDHVEKPSEN